MQHHTEWGLYWRLSRGGGNLWRGGAVVDHVGDRRVGRRECAALPPDLQWVWVGGLVGSGIKRETLVSSLVRLCVRVEWGCARVLESHEFFFSVKHRRKRN